MRWRPCSQSYVLPKKGAHVTSGWIPRQKLHGRRDHARPVLGRHDRRSGMCRRQQRCGARCLACSPGGGQVEGGRRRRTMVFCFFVRDWSDHDGAKTGVLVIALRAKVMKFGIIRTPQDSVACMAVPVTPQYMYRGAHALESVHSVSAVTWHLCECVGKIGVCRPVQTF